MFSIPSSEFDFGEIYTNTGSTISTIPISFPIMVNVFETGYEFIAGIWTANCEVETIFHYHITMENWIQMCKIHSCPTCDDGKIIVISDGGEIVTTVLTGQ